jgi:hypothetical protein
MIFEQKSAENLSIESTSSQTEPDDDTPISSSYLDWP